MPRFTMLSIILDDYRIMSGWWMSTRDESSDDYGYKYSVLTKCCLWHKIITVYQTVF